MIAAEFLRTLVVAAVPYNIHTILTDNGIQFTNSKQDKYAFTHIFDRVCHENEIEHRPWTKGQVERMNRTIKKATAKRYHYGSHEQLKTHMHNFMIAYNFTKRLKTLKGLTPHEYVCKIWRAKPALLVQKSQKDLTLTHYITLWD